MKSRYMISCAVSALVYGWGGAALAADPAAAPVSAEAAGIEEVIVTADRRDESVQKVPGTVQAFTGQDLETLNVTNVQDILKLLPDVTYGNNGPGQGELYIRGLSNGFRGDQSSATAGNFPNTAIYLDEQSMQFPGRNVDIYMVDMQRVELLEGPQGTLFGGGAEAGALRYITNKPQLDAFSGNVEVAGGTTAHGDPNYSANATLNIPIITDKLAVRIVLYDDHQGGYIDNIPSTFTRSNADLGNYYWGITPTGGKCPNGLPAGAAGLCSPPNSGQINNYGFAKKAQNPTDHDGARLSLAYKVNSDWDVLISESLQSLDAEGLSVEYPYSSEISPNNTLTPLAPLQVTSFTPSFDRDKYSNTAWTVNGKIFDDIKLIYTGGYTVRNIDQQIDYTNYSRTGGGMYYECTGGTTGWGGKPYCYTPAASWRDKVRNTHLTNEVRLSTPDDWRFRSIIGAYQEMFRIYDVMNFNYKTIPDCSAANYAASQLPGGQPCVANVAPLPNATTIDPNPRSPNTGFGEDATRGYDQVAFFGSFDFDVIPKVLTISGGTRWFQYSEFEVGTQYGTSTGCLDLASNVCTADTVDINAAHDKKVYTGHKSRANVTWNITDDVMAYYTYSEGFRPGGFNRSVKAVADYTFATVGGVPQLGKPIDPQYEKPNSYKPDSLTNNEIGIKSSLFNHHLLLDLSAYYMRWDDVQFLFFNPVDLGNTTFGVNGPNYDEKGVELQWAADTGIGLSFQGATSFHDNTQANSPCLFSNIPGSPTYGQCITQIAQKGNGIEPFTNPFGSIGSEAAFSPKWQGSLRARYDWQMMGDYNAYAMVGGNYMGGMYNQPATYVSGANVLIPNTTYLRYYQPSYTTFDASFGVIKDSWSATLSGTNLNNSHASTFTSSAQFIKTEVPLRPRVIMLKLGYSF